MWLYQELIFITAAFFEPFFAVTHFKKVTSTLFLIFFFSPINKAIENFEVKLPPLSFCALFSAQRGKNLKLKMKMFCLWIRVLVKFWMCFHAALFRCFLSLSAGTRSSLSWRGRKSKKRIRKPCSPWRHWTEQVRHPLHFWGFCRFLLSFRQMLRLGFFVWF